MANSKIKFCPMLTGKEEVKALTIGQGDCVVPTFHVCLQDHCAAFVEKCGGEKWCNHYHSSVEYKTESEEEHDIRNYSRNESEKDNC